MRSRSYTFGLAVLACSTVTLTSARAAECQDLSWSKDRLSKFDAAITSAADITKRRAIAQHEPHALNAAVASLEQDIAGRNGDAAAKGMTILNEIRASRDAYRTKLGQPVSRMMSAVTADAGPSRDEAPVAVWQKINAYLDAVDADVATRQAATQAKFVGN
jgi:hypothetical protein